MLFGLLVLRLQLRAFGGVARIDRAAFLCMTRGDLGSSRRCRSHRCDRGPVYRA
jgi:hypothetical protein